MKKLKKHIGVYSRASEGERIFKGHPDVCFYITYKKDARLFWEKVGWMSEGYTPKLASQIRSERLRTIRHGDDLPRERAKIPTFAEMGKIYLNWADKNKSEPNDHSRYKHLEGPLGGKRLDEISSFDLERIKANLLQKNLAPATVKHCIVLVRQIFNKAVEWRKYQGPNPIKGVKLPSSNNQRQRFLSHDEARTLLEELRKGSRTTYEMALLSLHTGLRASEIFHLKGQDVDLQNGILRVADSKNKSSRAAYMTDQVKEILKARMPAEPGDLVFLSRIHGRGQIRRASGFFQRTADSLFNKGVTDRRQRLVFHCLRHTFGSWLAIQGTPILTIKELMGHKTLAMTERYAHLTPDVKKDATLALEAAFNQSRDGRKVIPFAVAKEVPVSQ